MYIHTYAKIPQSFMRMHSSAVWPAEYSRRQGKGCRTVLPSESLLLPDLESQTPSLVCSCRCVHPRSVAGS